MRIFIAAIGSALLAGCASPEHYVADAGDPLAAPRQNETLAEELRREQQDGCLSGGGTSILGCSDEREELADLIGPPQFPEGVEITQVPPLLGPAGDDE